MAWAAARRATLLIPSGPVDDPSRKHLYIVLNDPIGDTGEVLIVCVCSIPASNLYDSSCTLFPGEHPFVGNQSYVAYNFAQISQAGRIEKQVADGTFVAKPMMDEKPFGYIIDGLLDSPRAAPKFKTFLRAALGLA